MDTVDTLRSLRRKYAQARLALLASLVLFLTGLFALVSRWASAVPLIVCACAFRLTVAWWARRRCAAAWTRAAVVTAAGARLRDVRYTNREAAPEGLLAALGFGPRAAFVPGGQMFHVVRGTLRGRAVTIAETVFIRERKELSGGKPLSGTLLTAAGALPKGETWAILWHSPFAGVYAPGEYAAWTAPENPASLPRGQAECFTAGGTADCLKAAVEVFAPYCRECGAALAARGGALSLLLPGTFYARRPDMTAAPAEESLRGAIPGVEVLDKLLAACAARECGNLGA